MVILWWWFFFVNKICQKGVNNEKLNRMPPVELDQEKGKHTSGNVLVESAHWEQIVDQNISCKKVNSFIRTLLLYSTLATLSFVLSSEKNVWVILRLIASKDYRRRHWSRILSGNWSVDPPPPPSPPSSSSPWRDSFWSNWKLLMVIEMIIMMGWSYSSFLFTTWSSSSSPLRVIRPEKPHHCNHCEFTSISSYNLTRHIMRKHVREPFKNVLADFAR